MHGPKPIGDVAALLAVVDAPRSALDTFVPTLARLAVVIVLVLMFLAFLQHG